MPMNTFDYKKVKDPQYFRDARMDFTDLTDFFFVFSEINKSLHRCSYYPYNSRRLLYAYPQGLE